MKTVKTSQKLRGSLASAALAAMLVLGLFASCAKSEGDDPSNPDRAHAILPVATVQAVNETKAAVSGTTFPENTPNVFGVTAFAHPSTAPTTDWSATPYFDNVAVNSGAASALTFVTPQYYPANGDKVYFYAYAPTVSSLTAGTASAAPIANYTITGQEDIMAAQETTGIAAATTGTQRQPALAFTHKLMQVRFKVVKDASFETGKKVTEVLVKDVKTSAKLDIATGALTFDGTADQTLSLPITAGTKDEITTAGTEMDNGVMCQPVGAGGLVTLKITAGGVVYDNIAVMLTGTNNGLAGTSHLITLTFKRTGITSGAQITDWAGEQEQETEMNHFYVPMFYDDAMNNGGATTGFTGATTTSYNAYVIGSNGTPYADAAVAFAGELPYKWLQVARTHEHDGRTMGWEDAMNACVAKTTDGGGWRMPRVSELKMMHNNKSSLEAEPGFDALPTGGAMLWAGTESTTSGAAFTFDFVAGSAPAAQKTTLYNVRCVREMVIKKYPYVTDGTFIVSKDADGESAGPFHTKWTQTPAHTELDADNAVGYNFAFASSDCNSFNPSSVTPDSGTNRYAWANAALVCASYAQTSGAAGTWRVPTFAEMQLIYSMRGDLNTGPPSSFPYWSATTNSVDPASALTLNFGNGDEGAKIKASEFCNVRCVRDL